MRASRFTRLPLTLALIAIVVIGGAALRAPTAPVVDASGATVARGLIRAVDATIVDFPDPRVGRSDRHAPRDDDLPFLLPAAITALGLACFGTARSGRAATASLLRLRSSVGPRAPPVSTAP